MANTRICTMVIKQILKLKLASYSNRRISKELNINRNTVNSYCRIFKESGKSFEELYELSEESVMLLLQKEKEPNPRFKILEEYFTKVKKEKSSPGFTFQNIWREYREEQIDGYSYSQFMEHYRNWSIEDKATLKLRHIAGEQLMVDFAGKKLSWVDSTTGELIDVEVFVACLPASGYTFVMACPSQKKEDFINCISRCLEFIGGVPKQIVVDNLKSAVDKASKYEAITNRSLRELGLHYDSALNPTRPYHPKDKAMVERMVRLVYEQIYFRMRNEVCFSLHELNERILQLVHEFNARKLSQLDCNRRELFEEIELGLLQPLPAQRFELKEYQRSKVAKTCHVYLSKDKHYYSVPYRFIGKRTHIRYSSRMVEVYYRNERIALHFRDRTKSSYTTKKEHLPSTHQYYLDWSPSFFLEKAKRIGPNTFHYISLLFDQHGIAETKYKTAMGIIQLKRQYERSRIEKAAQLAMLYPVASYKKIKGILEKQLDKCDDLFENKNDDESHIPSHENIRGAEYYNNLLNQNNKHHATNN